MTIKRTQYDPGTDAIIYGSDTTGFGSNEWIRLAMAALDQAGLSKYEQNCVADSMKKITHGWINVSNFKTTVST